MFYKCSSLSSLHDISNWNINNAINLNAIFSKCSSLISLPDISKWKAKSLKEMFSLFSDCLSLLFIPDISKWDNYNENDLNAIPDYNRIDNGLNLVFDFSKPVSDPESYDITNDTDYKQELANKKDKFL